MDNLQMTEHESAYLDDSPQDPVDRLNALAERSMRQEAISDFFSADITSLAATHPNPRELAEEWRQVSSTLLADIQLHAMENRAMAWKADEAKKYFPLMDSIMVDASRS